MLIEHCYECHSAEAKKLKGNLWLDSKAGWQKGGDSGKPIVVPGQPDESLLIRTIRHEMHKQGVVYYVGLTEILEAIERAKKEN